MHSNQNTNTMNLLEHIVIEVISEPYFKYNKWFIDVTSSCWGSKTKSFLMFNTKDECLKVEKGYKYFA